MYTGIGNSGHVAKPTLKNGLIWYWDLAASAASIVDSHSRLALTRSGTVNTLTAGAPDYGSCVEFPASPAAVAYFRNSSVARQAAYLDSFTANIWAMDYAISSIANITISHRDQVANALYFNLATVAGTPNFISGGFFNSVPTVFNPTFTQQPLNTWNMITLVKHAHSIDLYVNTEQVSQAPVFEGTVSANSAPFAIGIGSWATGLTLAHQHQGRLFAAGMWGRALKNPEIVALYNSGFGRRYENL